MLQALEDRDLDLVSGGSYVSIGNHNEDSFNTGGVRISHAGVDIDAGGAVQIGSNGGLVISNSFNRS